MIGPIEQLIITHKAEDIFLLGFLGTGISGSWPEQRPKTLDDWWNWGRDLVHILGNVKRPTGQKS